MVSMIHFLYIYARFTTTTPVIFILMYRFIALEGLCSTAIGHMKMSGIASGQA